MSNASFSNDPSFNFQARQIVGFKEKRGRAKPSTGEPE
jgi:hypothetical protein